MISARYPGEKSSGDWEVKEDIKDIIFVSPPLHLSSPFLLDPSYNSYRTNRPCEGI